MGINFVMGCHRCRKKVWMLRGKESALMHAFFQQHELCARESTGNVILQDDQTQREDWQQEYEDEFPEAQPLNA